MNCVTPRGPASLATPRKSQRRLGGALGLFVGLGLASTALAGADNALRSQLEVADRAPGPFSANAYRILFVGDSITRHGADERTKRELGWDLVAGMAASSLEKDFVHLLAARIQATMPSRRVEVYYDSHVTRQANPAFREGTFAEKHVRLQTVDPDFRPHLVVVQLGEHELAELGTAPLRASCERLLEVAQSLAPDGDVICAGVWAPGDKAEGARRYVDGWSAAVEGVIQTSCAKFGIPFASVSEFALDPACRGWGDSAGVQWHPNDQGMAGYARVLFSAFAQTRAGRAAARPVLPRASDVVLGGGIGAAYRLGVERLRQPPYESVAFIRADLTHELKRLFTNYSGDMSGRYIEVATLTAGSHDPPPVLAQLLGTLPPPKADGHFGAEVDWSLPLDRPDPLTAVKLPIFWGHSRLLVGLTEAYEVTREARLLEVARGVGDFYLATADHLLDPGRETEFRASGSYAAGYVTCYFPGIEGLVRLHRITGENRYLQQARRMADAFPAYDRLPLDHSHGSLLVHLGLLLLHEATGERAYLNQVQRRWEKVMTGGYVWAPGGVGERFKLGAGYDEGCALADWLRLNLKLWELTTETKYLDAAERLLANQYSWNRFPNGGYGQLTFKGDETGPAILQPGHHWKEGTWCCTPHGLLGLHTLKACVLAGSPQGIFINFPIPAVAPVRAMEEDWRVTTTILPSAGEEERLRVVIEGHAGINRPVPVLLRRPPWAATVSIVAEPTTMIATSEAGGYVRFHAEPGVPVTATFSRRPRMEDRRFGPVALDPSGISRHAKIVLASGPELLMANAENSPVVVLAVDAGGQLVLPRSVDGLRRLVTVSSLEADRTMIDSAIRSGGRVEVGTWAATDAAKPRAFLFDAIVVPSGSDLGRALQLNEPGGGASQVPVPDLPDALLVEAYRQAAVQNVLAAVNPAVFFGYWSVCADGQGHGYGNTYPALDGHQMTDALLWLGQFDVVQANWDYVKQFQRSDGQLPFAIWPGKSGRDKLWFSHHVPGDPLRALSAPTYIQNADAIFRFTRDRAWLARELPSINRAADHLATLVTPDGAVGGAGYYVERPTRVEFDGVAQCHAVDAFRRLAELNVVGANPAAVSRYRKLADCIEAHFRTRFWLKDQGRFIEYIHPQHGPITSHGLTDVDWSALATGVASPDQRTRLWPQLKEEQRFYYGGMPTGIATLPGNYEPWEVGDRMDLAAMGRVWFLEAWARTRMGDADGLVESLRRVSREGRAHGYFWRERYGDHGGFGVQQYCEYPANLVRVVQRFLLGVDLRLDGAVVLRPTVPDEFWSEGFGQTLAWSGGVLRYRMARGRLEGSYTGNAPLCLGSFLGLPNRDLRVEARVDGRVVASEWEGELVFVSLPAPPGGGASRFEVRTIPAAGTRHED